MDCNSRSHKIYRELRFRSDLNFQLIYFIEQFLVDRMWRVFRIINDPTCVESAIDDEMYFMKELQSISQLLQRLSLSITRPGKWHMTWNWKRTKICAVSVMYICGYTITSILLCHRYYAKAKNTFSSHVFVCSEYIIYWQILGHQLWLVPHGTLTGSFHLYYNINIIY